MADGPFKVSRRDLLVATGAGAVAGGAALVLGVWYGRRQERFTKRVPPRSQPFAPSIYLAIDGDGLVSIWLTRSEMGQGVSTALPMLIAEELEVELDAVRLEHAVANRNYGPQLTGNSAAVRKLWLPLRQAGAAARQMLIAAAAAQWGVPASECSARDGHAIHGPSGRRTPYGGLVEAAAALPVPAKPRLKPDDALRLLGRRLPRLDVPAKVDGSARFGLDVRLPGMRYATIVRCPIFGGSLASFDAASVQGRAGVDDVFELDGGVAIVGDSTWAVLSAAETLDVRWDGDAGFDDAQLATGLERGLEGEGHVARQEGDAGRWKSGRTVQAEYRTPFLAHATMEPINATAWIRDGRCEIWAPTQAPQGAQRMAMKLTGLAEPNVIVHVTLLGGGFGRRAANIEVRDAVLVAKRVKGPVQLVWSREADVQHDVYRAATAHRLEAALDSEGAPVAWRHRVASPSLMGRSDELDPLMLHGATELPYGIERVEVSWSSVASPVPLGFWRSVAHSYNAFAIECFLDELARAAQQDPVALRRKLLQSAPRHLGVLEKVAAKAGWGAPLAAGRARGVAVHGSFGSFVAMVAEVRRGERGVNVERVVAAVDCGRVVNPQIIEAQIEGGIVFGLTAALHGRIELRAGRVVQSNFHDYPMLRLADMPEVVVEILPSEEDPGGVGEIGVPPIAPAVANALASLGGEPPRELPISHG